MDPAGVRASAQRSGACVHHAGQGSARIRRVCRFLHRLVAPLALLLALGGSPAPAVAAPGDTLGVYSGSGNIAGTVAFGARLGRPLNYAHDFLDRGTWASMNDTAWLARRWTAAGYTDRLVLTVPMMPEGVGTLAGGAAGDYNQYFRTLAETLVATGQGSAVLRIGPEFNGNWYRWTIDVANGGALYAQYFRQIVNTMRAVPGASFKFDWTANNGSSWTANGTQLDAESAYPGDAYVDYIGLDVYDQSWGTWNRDPVARWNEYLNAKNGMRWHASFAASRGKPMTFPEWGLASRTDGNGGGDTPYFVEQMYWWLRTHNVAYHLYFESQDPNGEYGIFGGRFPNAAARFVELFGASGPVDAPMPPPAPPAPPAPPPPPPPPAPEGGSPITTGAPATADAGPGRIPPAAAAGAGWRAAPLASASSTQSAGADAAKLSIVRAHVAAGSRIFELLAPISRKASGTAAITLHAGGRRTSFAVRVNSARGEIKLRKRVSARQARTGTGIVEIAYGGDADTQPSSVRLRAAGRAAQLVAQRPRIENGRLRAQGTISKRARGVVRVQLVFVAGGERVVREFPAAIANGRWALDTVLLPGALAQIARRDASLHSYTLYTGYLPARIRGEMRSAQVLAAR